MVKLKVGQRPLRPKNWPKKGQNLQPYMWKESKSLHGKVDLVLCTVVEIGVPPGGGPYGRGCQLFCVGGKGSALTSHTK